MLLCGIIKPGAILHQRAILLHLEHEDITLQKKRIIRYTPPLIEVLYDHMPPEARAGIRDRLVGKWGMALLLEAVSIEQLLEVVGTESDPHACARGTIRALYGRHEPPTIVGADPWWENAFHRPIDLREAERDLHYIFG